MGVVVVARMAGIGMDAHRQPLAIERQPGDQAAEQRRPERDLVAGAGVRPDRLVVPAAELDLEAGAKRVLSCAASGLVRAS